MRWTINDILHNDNFNDLSKNDLLEIIIILRNDLKYYKYRSDSGHEQLNIMIKTLTTQIASERNDTILLKQVNKNYYGKLVGRLTLWERINGRIDLRK